MKTIFYVWTNNIKLLRIEHNVLYVHVMNTLMIHMLNVGTRDPFFLM